jgi:hypothetical protein
MEHRGLVGVECPQCHWKQFMELGLELQEWLRSRCPDHLGAILEKMKN